MNTSRDFSAEVLSSLLDASAAVNSAQGLDATLDAIARSAAAVMKAQGASVIMLDTVRDKQVFRAAVGDRAHQLVGYEYGPDEGLSGRALRQGKAIIVNDVAGDTEHFHAVDALTAGHTRSLIAAPLLHDGRAIGVVEVLNPVGREKFDETDCELCRLFANLAAVAAANAQLRDQLERENRGLRQAMAVPTELVGNSRAIEQVRELIQRVAPTNSTVLITGPTGTGKELVARGVHASSQRAERAFIAVNCAALPETLLESELFGHEAGAFTGATGRKPGRFELADGGTLLLDEIGEAPLSVQTKLLRALESREVVRVGGTQPVPCDVRVVTATNRDLEDAVRDGSFRRDLFYRLNVFPIRVPPLSERPEDVPPLVEHLVGCVAGEMKSDPPAVSDEAMAALAGYDYPGNVRELRNILERACLLCATGDEPGCIRPEHLPPALLAAAGTAGTADEADSALARSEVTLILDALRRNDWNQTRAARTLGISRDNLRYRIKKYNLRKPGAG
ncbi:MAG: sigma-54 interaction domain-containing protein [Phycisphaerae bacterium]